MTYFDSEYISNSDLKKLKKYWDPRGVEPENLEQIFDLGTLIHQCLLQPELPFKEGTKEEDIALAKEMAATFKKDKLCGQLMLIRDFRAEHEYYRESVHGVKARCKVDGRSKLADFVLEYKGLTVYNDRSFNDSILHLDYDQGAAWYLDVSKKRRVLIAGVSKKDPRRIFKVLIDRDHLYYKTGLEKIEKALEIYKELIG